MELAKDSTYDDFEPYCKWERYDSQDVLIVHLPDFKRNELKIQITKYGLLTISGECQPAKGISQISRFTKQIRISRDYYDEDQILAKFISGILYITMPHKEAKFRTNAQAHHTQNIKKNSKDAEEVREARIKQVELVNKNVKSKEMGYGYGLITSLIADRKKGKNVALMASVMAVSSLGTYAIYKLWFGSRKT